MKNFKLLTLVAVAGLAVISCGKKTVIEGTLEGCGNSEVIVKLLDVNRFQVLDTVKTNASGQFSYKPEIVPGQPEFIYIFRGNKQLASLLLENGDKVKLQMDSLGNFSVEGSEESLKLQQVEKDYNSFLKDIRDIAYSEDSGPAVSRRYISYYRDRLTYVMKNSHSLTVVPVLFQQVNPNMMVFDQPTDGILMQNVCDSLKTVYPESRYVRVLEKEAIRRLALMNADSKLKNAREVGYIDITLPGLDGRPITLSENLDKVTMLYFWSSTAAQKMYNIDAISPLYEEFHHKGLEIYSVALDSDKAAWAAAVRNQNLPWINVCDIRGELSPLIASYGIRSLPMVWFIVDGTIDVNAKVSNEADIRKYLRKKL